MVTVYAVVALAAVLIGCSPIRPRSLSGDDRIMVALLFFLTAWPIGMTFFVGPALLGGVAAAPWYPAAWYFPACLLVLWSLATKIHSGVARLDISAALLVPVSVLALLSLILGPGADIQNLPRWALSAAILASVVVKTGRIGLDVIAVGCRLGLLGTAVAIALTVLLVPSSVTGCRVDKCGTAGSVLTSEVAGNGNILGITVAMLLPFALARIPWWRGVLVIVGVGVICELSGSRTAIAAVVVIVLGYALGRLVRPDRRSAALLWLLGASVLASLIPAIYNFSAADFSYRAALWLSARSMIATDPVLGRGATAWETFGASALFDANYSPHNSWLDITVSVGLVGLLLIVAAVVSKVVLLAGEEREYLLLFLCGLAAASTLESLFVPYFLGIVPFTVVLVFMLDSTRVAVPPSLAPRPRKFTNKVIYSSRIWRLVK